jgi:hypothetical protein
MARLKRGSIKAEIVNSLSAAHQTSIPLNEPLSSQPKTYVSRKYQKGRPSGNFYDKV